MKTKTPEIDTSTLEDATVKKTIKKSSKSKKGSEEMEDWKDK